MGRPIKDYNELIPDRILIARNKLGKTQSELAEIAGVSLRTVQFWESKKINQKIPTTEKLETIANFAKKHGHPEITVMWLKGQDVSGLIDSGRKIAGNIDPDSMELTIDTIKDFSDYDTFVQSLLQAIMLAGYSVSNPAKTRTFIDSLDFAVSDSIEEYLISLKGTENLKMKKSFDNTELIRTIIDKFGTLKAFAKEMNLSPSALSRRLHNQAEFTLAEIQQASELLNLDADKTAKLFMTEDNSERDSMKQAIIETLTRVNDMADLRLIYSLVMNHS